MFSQNRISDPLYKTNLKIFIFSQNRNFGPLYNKNLNFFMFSQKQKFLHTPQKKYLSQKYLPKPRINRDFLNISYIYVE